ncbi:hypothetical protein BABINDRAFT_163232 [Babjeviella inositovora NRRL Y-12698]|uniref:Mitochondrial distribution and morphology protein 10 n=1 Tax=Babjeviella inositovora NRRL Y-12698 TaxID=984486 RepID=A0A1E3QJH7_9ASCO|nr:uncharacterized protein BABINDRAFT_163232 [Babjeviella inositovora NRRL Y-12698]ODQ77853.1 hypothetical protein BABINDRAFT_163232 [Babjeviella inositovora NRRL Y-12698]
MTLYMEHVQNCYFLLTGWDQYNFYDTLLHVPRRLLHFSTPQGVSFSLSNQSTKYTASNLHLTSTGSIQGSVGYCYSTVPLNNVFTTQDGIVDQILYYNPASKAKNRQANRLSDTSSLYYGRMYFPGSTLEAMYIKRFSPTAQLIVKCVSFPSLKQLNKNLGALTFNYQKITERSAREFIYSTKGGMLGFRYMYHVPLDVEADDLQTAGGESMLSASSLTVGSEVWYGSLNMSPGLSCALRYSSVIALHQRYAASRLPKMALPFSLSLACNPIIGQLSSSYCISTLGKWNHLYLASSYDFNVYSYRSDLTVGFEYYTKEPETDPKTDSKEASTIASGNHARYSEPVKALKQFERVINDIAKAPATELESRYKNFKSVLKSTFSLDLRIFKLLYDFRLGDFVVSLGIDWLWGRNRMASSVEEGCSTESSSEFVPFRPRRIGVSIQYSS